jgi:hypothetical protein
MRHLIHPRRFCNRVKAAAGYDSRRFARRRKRFATSEFPKAVPLGLFLACLGRRLSLFAQRRHEGGNAWTRPYQRRRVAVVPHLLAML